MIFNNQDNRKFSTAPQNEGVGISLEKNHQELPIDAHRESILEAIKSNPSVIIVGETGSGKTTRVPIFLLDQFQDKKIAVTSPRVLPARSVSRYVAGERGQEVGGEIGLMTREQKQVSQETRATFMTDGILLSMLQNDPMVSSLDIVMVDEAHERTINIDLTLGLLKQAQKLRKSAGISELKIIVTSATIEEEKFANYFDQSPVAKVPGRLYPVDISYSEQVGAHYTTQAANLTKEILDTISVGDVLIFMPGEEEIYKTMDEIKSGLDVEKVDVLSLYGAMNPKDQDKIFNKSRKRKVIVSTNIAETSVTIDGVKHVIDAGYLKQMNYNPETGINALELMPASQANMNQRMGRAGRTAPGSCYRLMSKSEFNDREAFQKPEIMRADLDEVVLRMKDMEIKDVEDFDFIDKPSRARVHSALESLKQLGALDQFGDITDVGKEMARLQLRPDLSRMLIEARHVDVLPQMVNVCSMLSAAKQVFIRPKISNETTQDEMRRIEQQEAAQRRLRVQGSDPLTLLNVWNKWQESNYDKSFAIDHLLNMKALKEISQTRLQLLRALGSGDMEVKSGGAVVDKLKITQCLLTGVPDSLFHSYDQGRSYDPVSSDPALDVLMGTRVFPGSSVFKAGSQLMLAMNITKSEKMMHGHKQETLYARTCHNVTLEELKKVLPVGSVVEKLEGQPQYDSWSNTYQQLQSVYAHNKLISQKHIGVETPHDGLQRDLYGRQGRGGNFGYEDRSSLLDDNLRTLDSSEVKYLLPEVYQNNRKILTQLAEYLRRADKNTEQAIRSKHSSFDEMAFYNEVISKIAPATKDIFIEHRADFEIKIEDFLSQEEQEVINTNCPLEIIGNGKVFKVTYVQEIYGELRGIKAAQVDIKSPALVDDFLSADMPSFSGIDTVTFLVTLPHQSGYSSFSDSRNISHFHNIDELRLYNEQYKKGEAKRLRRHERKATENLVKSEESATNLTPVAEPIEVTEAKKIEHHEKVEPVTLDVADFKMLISYFRKIAQEKNIRELKDKEKVLERIKEVSGKITSAIKDSEVSSGTELEKSALADFIQSVRVIAKRIGLPANKAEQLPYLFKYNKNALITSLLRNDVAEDEKLSEKLSEKSFEHSLESAVVYTEEEADEVIINLV